MRRTPVLFGLACSLLVARRDGQQPAPSSAPSGPLPVAVLSKPEQAPSPSTAVATTGANPAAATSFSFDADPSGGTPAGFSFARTGSGPLGRWVVRAEPDAPSRPNVLAQLDADDTDFRFPLAVAETPSLRDLRLSVRCKMVSGRVDQECGLLFRYRDENNDLPTRANPLESNIRLCSVKDGRRRQLASWSGSVTAGAWHEYVVEARGDHILVFWDGSKVLEHHDSTFTHAGRIGLWTKADSVTYFDDLSVTPLSGERP